MKYTFLFVAMVISSMAMAQLDPAKRSASIDVESTIKTVQNITNQMAEEKKAEWNQTASTKSSGGNQTGNTYYYTPTRVYVPKSTPIYTIQYTTPASNIPIVTSTVTIRR